MNYYNEIKNELINNEVYKKVKDYSKNRNELDTYYNIGKLLIEAQGGEERAKYGNKLIKEYSEKLTMELGKGYSKRNLYNMRLFYIKFSNQDIVQAVPAQLTWSHILEILNIDDKNKINYYIRIAEQYNLSYRELHNKKKSNEYERLDVETKNKLIKQEKQEIKDFIKHPILIRNSYNYQEVSEKVLKQLILEDISSFMKELGDGYTYVDNEYKIKIGERYNFIDLLLYNIKFNCYIVIELKVTELKAEYIGQIQKYINYIDKNIKTITQDKTIGIIICKKDNMFLMEYCTDEIIYRTTYELINI